MWRQVSPDATMTNLSWTCPTLVRRSSTTTDWPITLCLETAGEYMLKLFLFLPYNLLFTCIDHVYFNLKNHANYCKCTKLSSELLDIYFIKHQPKFQTVRHQSIYVIYIVIIFVQVRPNPADTDTIQVRPSIRACGAQQEVSVRHRERTSLC